MWPAIALEAGIVTKPEAKSLKEPEIRLAIELVAEPAIEPEVGLVIEPGARPAKIEKSLVLITSITIINISSSGLHNLIRTYSDKK